MELRLKLENNGLLTYKNFEIMLYKIANIYLKSAVKWCLIFLMLVLLIGFVIPQKLIIPVKGANFNDWNKGSYWHYPWGKSVTHKGIDIFAKKTTPVLSASAGLVWYAGSVGRGGNIVVVLGPKWRFHYYAHLDKINVKNGMFLSRGEDIGTVGNTGNALGKPPHLHYAIVSLIPLYWKADKSIQGWKKAYYLNPNEYLTYIK